MIRMSYLEDIKKRYAGFTDQELLDFSEKNAKDLTTEAKTVIKDEIAKRGLSKGIPETGIPHFTAKPIEPKPSLLMNWMMNLKNLSAKNFQRLTL